MAVGAGVPRVELSRQPWEIDESLQTAMEVAFGSEFGSAPYNPTTGDAYEALLPTRSQAQIRDMCADIIEGRSK